ncbi:MAG: preprotein translocase subunit SecG [Spirochaetota bacterium]
MGALSILLLVVFGITSVLLVVVVLLQDEGGEGLGGIFGGGGAGPVGNRSGNILTRTTTVLGTIFLVAAFGLAWLNRSPDTGDVEAAARRLEGDQATQWWEVEEEDGNDEPALDDEDGDSGDVAPARDEVGGDEETSAE